MIFALYERPEGIDREQGALVVYDLGANVAHVGGARVDGHALVWTLDDVPHDGFPELVAEIDLDPDTDWIMRCDRVDFPPNGVAYRHVHPGPGIRRMLFGSLTVLKHDEKRTFRRPEPWFESAEDPVLAISSAEEDSAFVRVLLLPAEWAGRRTIRYLDPADDERPKLQRASVLLEVPVQL